MAFAHVATTCGVGVKGGLGRGRGGGRGGEDCKCHAMGVGERLHALQTMFASHLCILYTPRRCYKHEAQHDDALYGMTSCNSLSMQTGQWPCSWHAQRMSALPASVVTTLPVRIQCISSSSKVTCSNSRRAVDLQVGKKFACSITIRSYAHETPKKKEKSKKQEPKKKQRKSAWSVMLDDCLSDSGPGEVETRRQELAAAAKALHYNIGKEVIVDDFTDNDTH